MPLIAATCARSSMTQAIGMIGIGLMGHGIARNVVKRGFPLTVMDHPGNRPLDELLATGARVCPTAAAVAAEADVVILCVTGSPQGEEGLTRPRRGRGAPGH